MNFFKKWQEKHFPRKQLTLSYFYLFISIAFVLWLINLIVMIVFVEAKSRGELGDMFGTVNALFSGLAFAALIYTLLMQKEELGLQRKVLEQQVAETKITSKELKSQTFEMSQQVSAMHAQAGAMRSQSMALAAMVDTVKNMLAVDNQPNFISGGSTRPGKGKLQLTIKNYGKSATGFEFAEKSGSETEQSGNITDMKASVDKNSRVGPESRIIIDLECEKKNDYFNVPFKIRLQYSDVVGNLYEQYLLGSTGLDKVTPPDRINYRPELFL